MLETDKILIPANEAASLLSMGRSTFWRGVSTGLLPQPVRIGGLVRWRVADLARLGDPAQGLPAGGQPPSLKAGACESDLLQRSTESMYGRPIAHLPVQKARS